MPEIIFDDLPQIVEENKKIHSQIHMEINDYLQNYHPKGWNRIDGAKKLISQRHFLIEAPIDDATFGGFIRATNSKQMICYINSAQPRMYQNFILFHELYHLLHNFKKMEKLHFIEVGIDNRIEERKADYFASLLLLDEHELRSFFSGTVNEKEPLYTKILLCMNAFKAPYKAILIRLFELSLIKIEELKDLFDQRIDFIVEFRKIGQDPYILESSNVINFNRLESLMNKNQLPDMVQTSNMKVLEEIQSFFSHHRGGKGSDES